jgi:hypothetical protein
VPELLRENREKILARHEPAPPREPACAGCGDPFIATNGNQRYCNPSCQPTVDRGQLSWSRERHERSIGGDRYPPSKEHQ